MRSKLSSLMTISFISGCGNPVVSSGNCERKESKADNKLMLAEGSPNSTALSHLPGGFLVYDEVGLETFITSGDVAKSVTPQQKCSALLIPRLRDGRAYFDVTSAESCLRPFVWGALNQRILLSLPGTTDYQEFKVKDARVLAVPKLFELISPLPEKVRKRVVDASTISRLEAQGYYMYDLKGWKYQSQESKTFLAEQCTESGKATPVPETCLWFNGHEPDSIEVELSKGNKETFEAMAAASLDFEQSSKKKLDETVLTLGKRISDYNANMLAFQRYYDELVLSFLGPTLLACKDAVAADACHGTTLEQRKKFTLSMLQLYRPSKIAEYELAFSSSDQSAAKGALRKKNDAIVVEGVKAHLAPAIESYFVFRREFVRRQDLVSVLSNHLDGTKLEPGKFSYRALSPFGSKIPEPLKGIQFSFKDGNVLLTHPGAEANQNLALDGHIGSVFAFGGLPVLGFGPSNIDQSDRASQMPLPRTTERADAPAKGSKTGDTAKNPAEKGTGAKDGGC